MFRTRQAKAAAAVIEQNGVAGHQSNSPNAALHYISEQSGNDTGPSYQEASGAPVEVKSPLGYSVGSLTILFLNVGLMVGTGVYSTPSTILKGTGSVGLSIIYWALGWVTSTVTFSVFLEFASYFPNRSGGGIVYLEQAFPRPKWFFSTSLAFQAVLLSFSAANSLVCAQYLFRVAGCTPSTWQLRGVSVAAYTVAALCAISHTKTSYRIMNTIGIVKIVTLLFIAITGLAVLGGHTRVPDPHANFVRPFDGPPTVYGLTNSLYKIMYSYGGYLNAFNVVNEVKNPIKKIKLYGFMSITIVAVLYILVNVAFFAAVPKDELRDAEQIAASLFFTKVFGSGKVIGALNFLICLGSFGNLLASLLGRSRMIRECGRQGVLPWTKFWVSIRPFSTPLGPYLSDWTMTTIMILAPPAGDAFNFLIDINIYPSAFFGVLLSVGIYIIRWRRTKLNLPRTEFRAWDSVVGLNLVRHVFCLVMPWFPPAGGPYAGNVSFWYATYAVTGIGIMVACAVYYFFWVYAIPRIRGYRIRQAVEHFDGGEQSLRLVRVPLSELEAFDEVHDVQGNLLERASSGESGNGGQLVDHVDPEKAHGSQPDAPPCPMKMMQRGIQPF